MIFKYLITSEENGKKRFFPAHPLSSRVFVVDGEFVPVDTEAETDFDKPVKVVTPSITDQIRAGETLKPMGTPPESTGLAAAEFAEKFARSFVAAGKRVEIPEPSLEPSPEPSPEPSTEPSK